MSWMDDPSLVRRDSELIDRLVEMIPPAFYFSQHSDVTPSRFLKGASAKSEAKKAAKERSKKAKRLKLDPDSAKSTVQLQIQEAEEQGQGVRGKGGEGGMKWRKEEAKEGEGKRKLGNEAAGPGGVTGQAEVPGMRAGSHEELRQRLQRRLQELREQRKAEAADRAKEWRDKRQQQPQKKQRQKPQEQRGERSEREKGLGPGKQVLDQQQQQQLGGTEFVGTKRKRQEMGSAAAELDFEFGKVRMGVLGPADKARPGRDKPKGKKAGEKESTGTLLKKAVALQKKLQQAELGGGQSAQMLKSEHAWGSAVSRAAGQKVLDDPALLQKSLKRQQKQRQKSAQKWDERHKGAAAHQKERQQRRQKNIQERKDKKLVTKIAKREKKLMRPGFEGRAGATPINRT